MDEFNMNNLNNEEEKQDVFQEENTQQEETVEADKVYEPLNNSFGTNSNDNMYHNPYNQSSYSQQSAYSQPTYETQQNPFEMQKKKDNKSIKVLCIILGVIVILVGAIVGVAIFKGDSPSGNSGISGESGSSENRATAGNVVVEAKKEAGALTTTEIAAVAKKSSVGVIVYSVNTGGYYFGSAQGGESTQSGEGSGVIVELDNQGNYTYIITCAHVISDKNISVKILLEDGTTYDADVVGLDERTDIGLLRVNDKSLQKNAATIGKSSELLVGQEVYAIGNPGGAEFFGSFTSGVVSAIGRSLSNNTGYDMECIQHDAAINPGNSGGALFNARGELVGINSSKIASTEYEGMSFAVPIDEAVSVVNNISSHGYVPNRPKLGSSYSLAMKYNQA